MTVNPIALQAAVSAIMSTYPDANAICRAVGVNPPDVYDGYVAESWLLSLRDNLVEALERIITADYPQDEVNSLESVPTGTYAQWQVWTELKLWQFDCDIAVMDTGAFPKPYPSYSTETVRAVKLDDIPDLAQRYEYEIAGNALGIMLQDAIQAYENALPEEEEDE